MSVRVNPSADAASMSLLGVKGGVGTSFLASELAAAYSSAGIRTAAIDADLRHGTLHYALDVPLQRETFTLRDLLPVIGDLSERVLSGALTMSPCGVRLLPSDVRQDMEARADPDGLASLMEALARSFEKVVIDAGSLLDGTTRSFLGLSDSIILVLIPEIACIGLAGHAVKALEKEGISRERMTIAVNRSLGGSDPLAASDIREYLGIDTAIVLPEEAQTCRRLSGLGEHPVHGRSPLARAIHSLAFP